MEIAGTDGEWASLLGKVIVAVEKKEEEVIGESDSSTRTTLVFKVDDATVISRWLGESNGYYSESVDFAEMAATYTLGAKA